MACARTHQHPARPVAEGNSSQTPRYSEFGSSDIASGGRDPEAALIARTAIWQALDVLPPRRRAIVVMYELEGLSAAAIASLLGISAITVRWHLSMGRHDLTRALKA